MAQKQSWVQTNERIVGLLQEGRLTMEEISQAVGCSLSHVVDIARKHKLRRKDVLSPAVDQQDPAL